ncbi:SDR family oxidoreductase [Clostridium sp. D2Q-11]|uniref:SDR family oxidoreductase n=1 Tax=Anaeromonas frigoriresistens TaxID=2683708 RepID=A0A942V2E2_9FIRM|nr:SDR family oxidoreductase [Anaeromonas frigoriresistens]MBS4538727.1 SDR family oxidoreductase [Anaeromonas frigoriresistens]
MSRFDYPNNVPAQHQDKQPGVNKEMNPNPIYEDEDYIGTNKLKDKVAIITGGDSGIGQAVSIAYAKEGADLAIIYLEEDEDAKKVKERVEELGQKCLLISGDIGEEEFCKSTVDKVIEEYKKIDILVNNAGEQHPKESILDISTEQLERTFKTNIFGMFHMVKAVLPHLKEGSSIINTSSITAYEGNPLLLDYSSTKGAVTTFTRSLSQSLIKKKIRVNGVAPGPIWTPLIPSTFDKEHVEGFGDGTPMGRPGQPIDLAPSYVFLASEDSSYIAGQMIHVNGGTIVNG